MTITQKFKRAMDIHGVTYLELGTELNRSPYTVKQRLNTESTFYKYKEEYTNALNACVIRKEKERTKALEELKGL